MQPHVPTSVALAQLLSEAPRDYVSLAWLMGRFQKRSFGLLMLILALLGLAPGIAMFTGVLLAYPAIQMILGHDSPALPHFLAARSIPTQGTKRLDWLGGILSRKRPPLGERRPSLRRSDKTRSAGGRPSPTNSEGVLFVSYAYPALFPPSGPFNFAHKTAIKIEI
jgi:Exopolysaccharide synthesis, ExoD